MKPLPEGTYRKILDLLLEGKNRKEIAYECRCHYETVRNVIKDFPLFFGLSRPYSH